MGLFLSMAFILIHVRGLVISQLHIISISLHNSYELLLISADRSLFSGASSRRCCCRRLKFIFIGLLIMRAGWNRPSVRHSQLCRDILHVRAPADGFYFCLFVFFLCGFESLQPQRVADGKKTRYVKKTDKKKKTASLL